MKRCNRLLVLIGIVVATFAGPQLTKAATITFSDVVNTADEWSFSFSGNGFQVIAFQAPAHVGWGLVAEVVTQGFGDPPGFGWGLDNLNHLPDGQVLVLDVVGPYGSTQTDSVTVPHDSGWDSVTMSLTVAGVPVAGAGVPQWGDFSGSFSAVHRGSNDVPEGGATLALLACALGALGFVRRAIRKA